MAYPSILQHNAVAGGKHSYTTTSVEMLVPPRSSDALRHYQVPASAMLPSDTAFTLPPGQLAGVVPVWRAASGHVLVSRASGAFMI